MRGRWIILLMLLAMLCGCAAETREGPWENLTLTIDNCTVVEPGDWCRFEAYDTLLRLDQNVENRALTIAITVREGDAETHGQLHYEDGVYTITDEFGTREYDYLQHHVGQSEEGVREFYILTDKEDLTLEKYAGEHEITLLRPGYANAGYGGEMVYIDIIPLERATTFGKVPQSIENLLAADILYSADYCEGFVLDYDLILSETDEDELLPEITGYHYACYDYDGRLLWQLETEELLDAVREMPGGGLIAGMGDKLMAISDTGEVVWEYTYPSELRVSRVRQILLHDDVIYAFGDMESPESAGTDDSNIDILASKLSMDGRLLQSKAYTGNGNDLLLSAEVTEDGILLRGWTGSSEGNFYLRVDRYLAEFEAKVSFDLEMEELRNYESRPALLLGYHDGQGIREDDPLVTMKAGDRLPEPEKGKGLLTEIGVFDTEEGYAVVRLHAIEQWKLMPYFTDIATYYNELIITGYDDWGNPLWQVTSDIFIN